ncbi:hypothetical protein MHI48_09520 [Paenibacillus sp. FSL H7-0942]|uniref:hypothetical protein n=1 Tax=Paenibacillus sp. FSL H7-0942 TaxID=2921444 RepID=UPI003254860E
MVHVYYSENLIPKMTSYTAPSGLVKTSNNRDSTYVAWRAFDSAYEIANSWATSNNITSAWISYTFPTSKQVQMYSIRSYDQSFSPKSWTFEGSNDGVTWDILDTKINESVWGTGMSIRRVFTLSNNKSYTSYRVNISSVVSQKYIIVEEIEMFEVIYSNKILLSSGGKYYSVLNDGIQETTSIPKMTSNTTPEGEVLVSNTPNGSFTIGWESFDGGLTNGWGNNTLPTTMPKWIGYKFIKPKLIVKYRLYVTNTTYYPRNYEFQGSNDGVNYDTLHSIVGGASGVLDYVIPNRKSYIYYRLYITVLSNGVTLPCIYELQMFEMKPSYLVQMESETETDFLNRGVGDLNDFNQILKTKKNLKKGNTVLGSGKTFEHTVDMSKRRVDKITLG